MTIQQTFTQFVWDAFEIGWTAIANAQKALNSRASIIQILNELEEYLQIKFAIWFIENV